MIPRELDLMICDWFSRRPATRWSQIPAHWRPRVHQLVTALEPWLERIDVRLVTITARGRELAAAYRIGRASAAPGQREIA